MVSDQRNGVANTCGGGCDTHKQLIKRATRHESTGNEKRILDPNLLVHYKLSRYGAGKNFLQVEEALMKIGSEFR